mgnify:CR=1 FL=1
MLPPGSHAVLPLQLLRQGLLLQKQSERPRVQEPQSRCGTDLLAVANIFVCRASDFPLYTILACFISTLFPLHEHPWFSSQSIMFFILCHILGVPYITANI